MSFSTTARRPTSASASRRINSNLSGASTTAGAAPTTLGGSNFSATSALLPTNDPKAVSKMEHRPHAFLRSRASRDRILRDKHPWVFDDEIGNISALGRFQPGSLVNVSLLDENFFSQGYVPPLKFPQKVGYPRKPTLEGWDEEDSPETEPESPYDDGGIPIVGVGKKRIRKKKYADAPVAVREMLAPGELSCETFAVGVLNRAASISIRILPTEACDRPNSRIIGLLHEDDPLSVSVQSLTHFLCNVLQRKKHVLYGPLIDAEVDGVPGLRVDRYGKHGAVLTFFSIGAHTLFEPLILPLLRDLAIVNIGVHRIVTVKERYSLNGEEFASTLIKGKSPIFVARDEDATYDVNLYHGRDAFNYKEATVQNFLADLARNATVLDLWSRGGEIGIKCAARWNKSAGAGISSSPEDQHSPGERGEASSGRDDVHHDSSKQNADHGRAALSLLESAPAANKTETVLLEESVNFSALAHQNVTKNQLESSCMALHRVSIRNELRSMAMAGVKFSLVILQVPLRFGRKCKAPEHRRSQFGRWFRPDLKGVEGLVRSAAQVVAKDGYLAVRLLLPEEQRGWGTTMIRYGLDRSNRTGSLVFEQSCGRAGLAREMDAELWGIRWYVVRLHD